MTFSLVARDAGTGQLGIAVASHVLAVGRIALFTEPGVGSVATQSLVLMAHGARVLDAMREGRPAADALDASIALDEQSAVRQVGVVDAAGRAAAFTGPGCVPHASHVVGDGVAAQTNMAARAGLPEAMLAAYDATDGPLTTRLLAALDAGEAAGGDHRGRQSAALVVTAASSAGDPLLDRVVDVRVDDSPGPLVELRRLTGLALANHALDRADVLLAEGDVEAAAAAYESAVRTAPDYPEFRFWQAVSLAGAGRADAGRAAYAPLLASPDAARWVEMGRRVADAGLVDPAAVAGLTP